MTAPDKAESALHRSGYVMDTGAAFPPDLRPWPRDLGPWSPRCESGGKNADKADSAAVGRT